MRLIAALKERFTEHPPRERAAAFVVDVSAADEPDTVEDIKEAPRSPYDVDVHDIVIGITYVGANGTTSRRRIDLQQVTRTKAGNPCFLAFCRERRAMRTFRLDRIVEVFDAEGVVYDLATYFRDELAIELPPFAPDTETLRGAGPAIVPKSRKRQTDRDKLRRFCAPEIRVLAAMGHGRRAFRPGSSGDHLRPSRGLGRPEGMGIER